MPRDARISTRRRRTWGVVCMAVVACLLLLGLLLQPRIREYFAARWLNAHDARVTFSDLDSVSLFGAEIPVPRISACQLAIACELPTRGPEFWSENEPLRQHYLSSACRLTHLQHLGLGDMPVSAQDIDRLCRSLPLVWSMELGFLQEEPKGAAPLAALPELLNLDLGGSNVTDSMLSDLRHQPRLNRLVLDHTAVTDAGIRELRHLPALRNLSVSNTEVSEEALAELRKSLPALEVSDD